MRAHANEEHRQNGGNLNTGPREVGNRSPRRVPAFDSGGTPRKAISVEMADSMATLEQKKKKARGDEFYRH